jgi:hypothetical protein
MRVAEVARRGLESPEHAAFVARLQERAQAGEKRPEAARA